MKPLIIILQNPSSFEIRSVLSAILISDKFTYLRSTIEDLTSFKDALIAGAMPIGSVEFVRLAMQVAGIIEPENISYPTGCDKYLCRKIVKTTLGNIENKKCFIKPVLTKQFTGCIFNPCGLNSEIDVLPLFTQIWISEIVEFKSEWRYYIKNHKIIGYSQYHQTNESIDKPNIDIVNEFISQKLAGNYYCADFGVLQNGETALIEVNDAWAIGLYVESISSKQYLDFLWGRWSEIQLNRIFYE